MKINPNFNAFNISAQGMGAQKRKMDLIAENIANVDTTKTKDGTPYKRKYLVVEEKQSFGQKMVDAKNTLRLRTTNGMQISSPAQLPKQTSSNDLESQVKQDATAGEMLYMPDHPDANEDGYVRMPNVNVVTEMVDMIAATRSYEANLTAFNASKQIAKDSLEI